MEGCSPPFQSSPFNDACKRLQVFAQFGGLLEVRGSGSAALQRLSREGLLWAPCVGNICTFIAFLMALALNSFVSGVLAQLISLPV